MPYIVRARPYLIATILGILIFFPTSLRLLGIWLEWEQVMAHGLPAALMFLGLLVVHPPSPSRRPSGAWSDSQYTGGLLLVLTVLVWTVLELARIDTLTYLLIPPGIFLTTWSLMGYPAARAVFPHLMVLGLSLPVWADFIPALVSIATVIVTHAVDALGITALIEGSNITLPYGRLVITDGCSGIGYMAVSILLASTLCVLNDYRYKGWIISIGSAVALALIINWVRIIALVVIGYVTKMESELVREHELFGWLIFGAFILPALYFHPAPQKTGLQSVIPAPLSPRGWVFVVAALVLGPAGLELVRFQAQQGGAYTFRAAEMVPVSAKQLPMQMQLPRSMRQEVWQATDSGVTISVAHYERASDDTKVVPYLPANPFPDNWYHTANDAGTGVEIWAKINSQDRTVVQRLFRVGRYTTDDYRMAKILQIPAIFRGETGFTMFTIQAPCNAKSCVNATDRIVASANRLQKG